MGHGDWDSPEEEHPPQQVSEFFSAASKVTEFCGHLNAFMCQKGWRTTMLIGLCLQGSECCSRQEDFDRGGAGKAKQLPLYSAPGSDDENYCAPCWEEIMQKSRAEKKAAWNRKRKGKLPLEGGASASSDIYVDEEGTVWAPKTTPTAPRTDGSEDIETYEDEWKEVQGRFRGRKEVTVKRILELHTQYHGIRVPAPDSPWADWSMEILEAALAEALKQSNQIKGRGKGYEGSEGLRTFQTNQG
jgi:hypothetical protein